MNNKINTQEEKVRGSPYSKERAKARKIFSGKRNRDTKAYKKRERFRVTRFPQRSSLSRKRGYSFSGKGDKTSSP
ncbi:hypothetical protein [Porphyromonas endodontalis]|uniref:hypothetical protein n=1 Tax=Porphyromonas endodontalis TaxID=28124 RepID=UPI0028EBA9EA|nr:hypothetical protein [Porphyromonas endodontalis]